MLGGRVRRMMSQRSVAMAAICVACAALLSAVLSGYTLSKATWADTRVVYYVNPQSRWVSPSAAIAAIQTAAQGWHAQSNANIELVYGGTTSGNSVTLNYKNEVMFRNESGGGYTYRWWNAAHEVLDADIVLYEGSRPLFTGTSGCSGGTYVEDLATHEFGHVLGLSHSSDGAATMYPTTIWCTINWRSLAADDITGIRLLYPGGTSPTPTAPAAPSLLGVAGNSSDPTASLLLSWADNSGSETGFRVERSTDGRSFSPVAQLAANVTWYTDLNLIASTRYYYRVAAFNGVGSSYSAIASGATQAPQISPTPPADTPTLTATGSKRKGLQQVSLRWSGFSTSSVDIYRDGVRVSSTSNDGAEVDAINRKGGGSYIYKVCGTGTSTCSNVVTVSF